MYSSCKCYSDLRFYAWKFFFKPTSLGGFGTVRVARVELEPESPEVNYVASVVSVGEQKCDNNVAIL